MAGVVAALSVVSDLARAHPPGEAMRACLLATELARRNLLPPHPIGLASAVPPLERARQGVAHRLAHLQPGGEHVRRLAAGTEVHLRELPPARQDRGDRAQPRDALLARQPERHGVLQHLDGIRRVVGQPPSTSARTTSSSSIRAPLTVLRAIRAEWPRVLKGLRLQ